MAIYTICAQTTSGIQPATGKLAVYAIDARTGKAVAGATVVVVELPKGQSVDKGLTDANGSYSTALPAGAYKVGIFARGYKSQSEAAKIEVGKATFVKIAVKVDTTAPPAVSSATN